MDRGASGLQFMGLYRGKHNSATTTTTNNYICVCVSETVSPNRSRRDYEELSIIHRKLYKKGLNDWGNHYDIVTHLDPGILECEFKWALGSITTNKAS